MVVVVVFSPENILLMACENSGHFIWEGQQPAGQRCAAQSCMYQCVCAMF